MSLASLRGIWGIAGFVVCGSTGEAATLTDTEQQAVLDTVLRAAGGLPVLMGLSGVATSTLRERLLRLAERPVAGFLVSPPYYIFIPRVSWTCSTASTKAGSTRHGASGSSSGR
jgi:dihydrodipicolinate synthase/N-acetylneuraminate lyase